MTLQNYLNTQRYARWSSLATQLSELREQHKDVFELAELLAYEIQLVRDIVTTEYRVSMEQRSESIRAGLECPPVELPMGFKGATRAVVVIDCEAVLPRAAFVANKPAITKLLKKGAVPGARTIPSYSVRRV